MAPPRQASSFRRAIWLMTLTSFLVPAAGVVTAPVLARGLSTQGRGELAAALAPAALMLAAATLGLPEALTFYLAKHPRLTRPALVKASALTVVLSLGCVGVVLLFLPFLSSGNRDLGRLILLSALLTVPALVVGVFRGAAIGRQMWKEVAIERLVNVVIRVVGFVGLWVAGRLTVYAAVLLSVIGPVVSGVVYLRLLHQPGRRQTLDEQVVGPLDDVGDDGDDEAEASLPQGFSDIAGFGMRVWFGGVASMLLSRAASTLMVPLAGETALGLYAVATTISDLPLIVALAIQGTLFGVNSKVTNAAQVTSTARLTLLFGAVGCLALGGSLPFWIGPLFGAEYQAATLPTVILMGSAVLCIPGLMASTGVAAWGRPGLRSAGLALTLVVNVGAFFVLVPRFGVYGACWVSLLSNVVLTTFMLVVAQRVMRVSAWGFVRITGDDVRRGIHEVTGILSLAQRLRRRPVSPVMATAVPTDRTSCVEHDAHPGNGSERPPTDVSWSSGGQNFGEHQGSRHRRGG